MTNANSLRWHYPDQVMRVERYALLSAIEGSPLKCTFIKHLIEANVK